MSRGAAAIDVSISIEQVGVMMRVENALGLRAPLMMVLYWYWSPDSGSTKYVTLQLVEQESWAGVRHSHLMEAHRAGASLFPLR